MKADPLLAAKIRLDAAREQIDGILRQVRQVTRKLDAAFEQLSQDVWRVPVRRPYHNHLRNHTERSAAVRRPLG
jgi:hypothetical protein